ncbi:MAG TPA: hypothetical protein VGG39_28575 [Polyangiaceae bacterium]
MILSAMPPVPHADRCMSVPMWRCVILDAERWRAVDPLQPETFPAWFGRTMPMIVIVDGTHAARFEPTDAAVPSEGAPNLSLSAYELICEQHGTEDTCEIAEGYERLATSAVREVRPTPEMRGQHLREWRGELEVRERMSEAVLRGHGVAPDAVGGLLGFGRVYSGRKSLIPTCATARAHDERKRLAAEAEKAAEEAARVAAVEAARPRTPRELGADIMTVRRGRLGVSAEPFDGARVIARTETEDVIGWKCVEAMHHPSYHRDGVRSVDRDDPSVLPYLLATPVGLLHAQLTTPGPAEIAWLRERRIEAGLDFGPMRDFSTTVPDAAREFARRWTRVFHAATHADMWRPDWVTEVLVRSEWRLRPDLATEVLLEALEGEFDLRNPGIVFKNAWSMHRQHDTAGTEFTDMHEGERRAVARTKRIESHRPEDRPSVASRTNVGNMMALAADRGLYVSAGESIAPPAATTTKTKKAK